MMLKLSVALTLFAVIATTSFASAESTYFTPRSILKDFFPASKVVSYSRFTPSPGERKAIEKRLGYKLTRKDYVFYVAKTGDTIDGYAFIGNQLGQHLPITYAVKLSTAGAVLRQEIMVYREQRGGEIRDKRFRQQFTGKTAADALRLGGDIDVISGATISSRAIAVGVKRALVLFEVGILNATKLASAQD